MAPTHRGSEDSHNKAQAMLDALEAMSEMIAAYTEETRKSLHDTEMRRAALVKELTEKIQHDRAVALEGSDHQLQKVMQNRLGHLPESRVEELFAPKEVSANLAVGEGQVDDEIRAKFLEILDEQSAKVEQLKSIFRPKNYTTYFRDADNTKIFANANAPMPTATRLPTATGACPSPSLLATPLKA